MCASELPVLVQDKADIRVEGFTDRVGTDEYNCRLAKNRAKNIKTAIRDILGEKLAIPDSRTEAVSLGESLARSAGNV
jgi:outer membrane protein OmpA-like peptidoglycan-associated protein